jgi:hypothetical protein
MLIAFCSDTALRVYQDVDDAVRSVEALDAAETFVRVFDDVANPYRINWIRPNHESRLLGIRAVTNGEYTLVVSGQRRPGELLSLIRSAEVIEPPALEPRIRELERSLSLETAPQWAAGLFPAHVVQLDTDAGDTLSQALAVIGVRDEDRKIRVVLEPDMSLL